MITKVVIPAAGLGTRFRPATTTIPKEEIHRLENKEDIPLEIIEIQTGEYLGEDDIIRLEDDYQRN